MRFEIKLYQLISNYTMSETKFVHLHTHSHYSMLDGMGKIPELVQKAKELGMSALALTDHGVMHGVVEFYEECEKEGIKPIIGCEVYIAPRSLKDKVPRVDADPYHLILLAKNEQGYKNLIQLTTAAHLEGYYYKPRVDKSLLKKFSDGLIATTACIKGEVPRKALENTDKGRAAIKEYLTIFKPDNLYLEVQHHDNVEYQKRSNDLMFKLAEEFNLKVIATNDIHYVHAEDREAQDALICLQTTRVMDDTNRLTMKNDDYSMISPKSINNFFPDHTEVLSNTIEIANKCNLKLNLGGIIFPDFPIPASHTMDSYFKEKSYLGLNWRYGEKPIKENDLPKDRLVTASDLKVSAEIFDRFNYELDVITKMKYQGYFLIVADFINWAKDQGISVGPGRGSGAGSVIAYSLNITELDPLKYGLLFERFLNPDRISMPDFDSDFADSRRNEVVEYVAKKYGRDHVAQIITFGTMAARMAVRDVGRVLSMSYTEVDVIAKLIPFGMTLDQALKEISELKEIYNSDAKVKKCIDIARRLEGVVRHASMHAAGVVISKDPLTEYLPLQKATKGDISTVTQYGMNPIEHLGLIKFDFLGLANLTIIQNALRIIRKTKEKDIDLASLPLDDKDTYKLLSRALTTGVFQLESDGMKRYLRELKPTLFEDIIAMVALYRPGPMQFIDSFIARKHGREQIIYPHPKARAALESTYGIIVYQEQLMQLSKDMAGFTGGQADTLRKATGKKIKELMKKIGREFVDGCVKHGIDKEIAENLYNSMQDFAQYSFNKSHAACYALIAYETAYLKAHFSSEFMAALMTSEQSDLDKLAICIAECDRLKILVLPPSVNESFVDFGVVKESGNIRFGLAAIKNVGVAVADEIVEERKAGGTYSDVEDFVSRLGSKVINKKSVESLIMAGALDDLGERAELLFNLDKILAFASAIQKGKNSGQSSLFDTADTPEIKKINLEETKPADKKQRLSWERELLGMYVSEHPLSDLTHLIEPNRTKSTAEIKEDIEGEFIRVAGIITSIQSILTRTNQRMLFVRLEDLQGSVEVLVFPKILSASPELWATDKILAVDGYLNYKDGTPKILAESAYALSEKTKIPPFKPRPKRQNNFNNFKNGNNKVIDTHRSLKQINTDQTDNNTIEPIGPSRQTPLISKSKKPKSYKLEAKSLSITIPPDSDRSILIDIKKILLDNPGPSPVIIRVPNNGLGYKEIRIKNQVLISPVLHKKLRDLVDKENLLIKSD